MNEILSIILKDTYTLTQLKYRLNVLKSSLLQTFFGSTEQKAALSEKDYTWLKSLPDAFFQSFNKDNIYDNFSKIEKDINQLKLLTIYLTFEPDGNSLTLIGQAVRQTFPSTGQSTSSRNLPLILDIKFDPKLIAGVALVWNGIYKDYSLRSKIEQKKSVILNIIKEYLR